MINYKMNTLKSNRSNDEISFKIGSDLVCYFSIVKLENVSSSVKLVENLIKKLEKNNINEISVNVPFSSNLSNDNDYIKEFNRIIPNETDYYVKKGITNYYVSVSCDISKFLNYYRGILYRLATPDVVSYSGTQILPDNDGWIKVVNKKKIKRENKKQLNKSLKTYKKKFGNWHKK